MSGKRLRLVILLVPALVVIGYLPLVGGTVGDSGHG